MSEEEVDDLFERIASLEQQSRDLRAQLAEPAPAENDRQFDRRKLLRLGGVAAAAGAGSVLLRPSAAGATTGAMQFGQQNDAGSDSTGITSSNATDTLHVTNSADAIALELRSGGAGVVATGFTGGGVVGTTRRVRSGVMGQGQYRHRTRRQGRDRRRGRKRATIEAAQAGHGDGVFAHIDNTTSGARSVHAKTNGTGEAMLANIANATNKSAAVRAQTSGAGIGVDATSALGIGGRFVGKAAQIQLVPASAASHPTSGIAGELFVDHSNRLWFCKGGTNWRQLA